MYPTRDIHFHRATKRRLDTDSRIKVYGKDTGSLLVQHSYPELANVQNQNAHLSHSNNYSRHSPHKPELVVWKPINIKQYNITKKIGSGTYGSVFHALSPCRGEVAIKQLCPMHNEKTSQDGFHITAIREIKILKALDHTNIISLHDVLCCKENVMAEFIANDPSNSSKHSKYKPNGRMQTYMVFEYMHHDLSGLLHNEHVHFTIEHIKYFMCQLFNALQYCHDIAHILHRDIKSSNLLVDNNGVLKIADFGLARQFIPALSADCRNIASTHASVNHKHPRHYTNRVVTLWYRAPELLLSDVHYTPAVDLWSVGCVFAELLFNKPIFTGKNEMEQWFQIIEVCGWNVAKESEWTSTLRDKDGLIATMKKRSKAFDRKLKTKFQHFTNPNLQDGRKNAKYLDKDGFALLEQLLTVNPKRRISAKEGSTAQWFRNSPYPSPPKLGAYQSSHDYEQRQLRKNPNYKANHFNNNGNHRNNHNANSYNNTNNGGKARYSYSYNGVSSSSASNKVNGSMNNHSTMNNVTSNNHNSMNRLNGNQYRQNSRGARDRSRSRSRERKGLRSGGIPSGDSRSGSAFDAKRSGTHSKEGSVTLPPPIKRLQPLHTAPNHNVVNAMNAMNGVNGAIPNKPMVVTLQAPTMKMNIARPNPVVTGNGRNVNGGFNGNNNARNGFKPWNNNNNKFENKSTAFYARFKKPDELKGRSRF